MDAQNNASAMQSNQMFPPMPDALDMPSPQSAADIRPNLTGPGELVNPELLRIKSVRAACNSQPISSGPTTRMMPSACATCRISTCVQAACHSAPATGPRQSARPTWNWRSTV